MDAETALASSRSDPIAIPFRDLIKVQFMILVLQSKMREEALQITLCSTIDSIREAL